MTDRVPNGWAEVRNYLKRPKRVIPDLIRNLPEASIVIFREILNRVQDDLPVLRSFFGPPGDFRPHRH